MAINYTSHEGKNDIETLKNIIEDIEYLRAHGTNPWTGASGRSNMNRRFTYGEMLFVDDTAVEIDVSTTAS